jgi:hypothetical protein
MERALASSAALAVIACVTPGVSAAERAFACALSFQNGVDGYQDAGDTSRRPGTIKLVADVKRQITPWHEQQIKLGKTTREKVEEAHSNYRHVLRWDRLDHRVRGRDVRVTSATVELFYTDEFWSFYDYTVTLHRSLDATKDNIEARPAAAAHILGERRGRGVATPFRSWVSFELRPKVIQQWIDNPQSNCGLVLINPKKEDPPGKKSTGSLLKFASNTHGMPLLRPKLTIRYEFTGNVPPMAPRFAQRLDGIRVGGDHTIRWSMPAKADLNGDAVRFEIQLGPPDRDAWRTIARDLPGRARSFAWKTAGVAAQRRYRLRIRAVDVHGAPSAWTEGDGAFTVVRGDVPFQIGIEPPLTKLHRTRPYRGRLGSDASIELARSEAEGLQVVVAGVHRGLVGVRVVPGDLRARSGGRPLRADCITVHPVGYVHTVPPTKYDAPWAGLWPDPLLNVERVDIPAGKVQPFWVTVHAPADAPADTYRGKLTVDANGIAPQTVELTVRVFDFALPVRSSLRAMAIAGGPNAKFYRLDEGPQLDRLRERWFDFLCGHRLPPGGYVLKAWSWDKPAWPARRMADGSYDFRAAEKWGRFCFDRGMSTFVVASFPKPGKWGFPETFSDAYYAGYTKFMKAYAQFLRGKGWLRDAVVYNVDEAPPKHWAMCRENYRRTKGVSGDLAVFQCLNNPKGVAALAGAFDVVDVNLGQFYQGAAPKRLRDGGRVWWCVCCWPSGHPNLFVEYPAMDARIIGWLSWKLGVEGFEYWDVSSWGRCLRDMGSKKHVDQVESRWNANSFGSYNGDGYLCYPGPNRTLLSSIRFEALRDGFEDYEYLAILKRRLGAKTGPAAKEARKLLQIGDDLCRKDLTFAADPAVLFAARRKIAEAIEKLSP